MAAMLAVAVAAYTPMMSRSPAVVSRSCASAVRMAAPAVDVAEDPKVESSCGFDFVPLLTALKSGDFLEADQLTRDGLITLAGEAAQQRGYVYFTEVPHARMQHARMQRAHLRHPSLLGLCPRASNRAWIAAKAGLMATQKGAGMSASPCSPPSPWGMTRRCPSSSSHIRRDS